MSTFSIKLLQVENGYIEWHFNYGENGFFCLPELNQIPLLIVFVGIESCSIPKILFSAKLQSQFIGSINFLFV